MGVHDSYREILDCRQKKTKNKGEGSNHRGELRIGHERRGRVQYKKGRNRSNVKTRLYH
jgi:hypothetical protein